MTTSPPYRRSARNITTESPGICKISAPVAGAANGVLEQAGDRHRADAAGHRRHAARRRSAAPGSTSPTRPASVRLMPTSITTPPVLTMSGVTIAGTPDRGDEHVGVERVPRRGPACANGRSSPSRSPAAAGAPSACRRCRCGRPRPRARRRARCCARGASPSPRAASPATSVGRPRYSCAGVERMEPVDVLGGSDRAQDHLRLVDVRRGSGSWTRIASTCVVRIQLRDLGEQLLLGGVGGQPQVAARRSPPRSRPCA